MSDMIERVALTIATKNHTDIVKHNLSEINQLDQFENHMKMWPVKVTDGDRELARAAIGAMREPTDAMCEAAEWHQQSDVNAYQCAIDAAIG